MKIYALQVHSGIGASVRPDAPESDCGTPPGTREERVCPRH